MYAGALIKPANRNEYELKRKYNTPTKFKAMGKLETPFAENRKQIPNENDKISKHAPQNSWKCPF